MHSAERRRRGGPQRGADLRYDLEISFEEAAKGTEAALQIPRQEICETCKGNGAAPGTSPVTCPQCQGRGQIRYQQGFFTVARTCGQCRGTGSIVAKPCQTCRGAGRVQKEKKLSVRIPAGIATGQRLRLSGEGEAGPGGGPPGDLYVVVHVQEHPFFQRDGNDLYCEIPLNFPTLALGGDIKIPTLDGEQELTDPGRHAERRDVPRAWPGHARRQRSRPRRSARHRQGQHAEEADEGTEEAARTAGGTLPNEAFEPTPTSEHADKGLLDRVKDIFG